MRVQGLLNVRAVVSVNFLSKDCLVQVERWPGSWFWAKIVGVYAGDGPLRERVHGGEDTARVVIPGVDDWELDRRPSHGALGVVWQPGHGLHLVQSCSGSADVA